MTRPRVLIAGIGNIFLGDDAFGVEVAQRLLQRPQPAGVRVVDFGIRGLDLVYALLDGCDCAILIDAAARGGAPGTLYLINPEIAPQEGEPGPMIEAHSMDPVKVLRTVAALGGALGRVLVVGCEPMPFDANSDDALGGMSMGLSDPVRAAVDEAVAMVESLARDLLARDAPSARDSRPEIAAASTSATQHRSQEVPV